MAKRSISDEEIALIKAMAARGMKNKDIQLPCWPFLTNRCCTAPNRQGEALLGQAIGEGGFYRMPGWWS